ncbi:ribosome maturation factor RimM [Sphingosinithalassobacter sp. CS137]|uniref:ribosome maturation factor RimM n=1 Tax=Sphingosinithalassobacter sp. CS137 TaxID=2762748 RepID=UPI00165E8A12|nr:ribosome maturation factor RimM [Sphingosinithalassobacter sp. CS137]
MAADANPPPTPPARGSEDRAVTLAAVIGAHGITGEVRLKVFAEDIGRHKQFNGGALTLKSLREGPNGAIARFVEIADRNAAEALRGTELTVPRSALPPLEEGEYYHVDLLDLPVEDEAGTPIGRVVAIDNYGAGDVLEIEKPDGKRFMVPMIPAAVPEWTVERLIVSDAYAE